MFLRAMIGRRMGKPILVETVRTPGGPRQQALCSLGIERLCGGALADFGQANALPETRNRVLQPLLKPIYFCVPAGLLGAL